MRFSKGFLFAAVLLLVSPLVFGAAPRMVINELAVSPDRFAEGDSPEISVQLQNAGDAGCSGEVKIFFADADTGSVLDGLTLEKQVFVPSREWKTVLFSDVSPPALVTGALQSGTFQAIAKIYCNSRFQDEKNAFFSVVENAELAVPETSFSAAVLVAMAGIGLLFFRKK